MTHGYRRGPVGGNWKIMLSLQRRATAARGVQPPRQHEQPAGEQASRSQSQHDSQSCDERPHDDGALPPDTWFTVMRRARISPRWSAGAASLTIASSSGRLKPAPTPTSIAGRYTQGMTAACGDSSTPQAPSPRPSAASSAGT